jgi:hypothetical protein
LDATLVLVELLREVMTAPRTPIDLSDLVQRLPGDASISTPSRRVKASVSLDKEGSEIAGNPRALMLLLALNAAFVTLSGDSGCHLTLSRRDGTHPRLVLEPGAQSSDTIELLVPRLLKASKVCAQSAARALGAELNWVKNPRTAELKWIA